MQNSEIRLRWNTAIEGRQDAVENALQAFKDLLSTMADLRGPHGCPWDAEQSLASLRQYVLEEAHEVVSAIDDILSYEDQLRSAAGIPLADPSPPGSADQARTEKKGLTIGHHPHRNDFNPSASAAGAPMPMPVLDQHEDELCQLYEKLVVEIGDLALQVAFLGDILHAQGRGGVEASLGSVVEKLIRRHPHVYGDIELSSSIEVLENWERIKASENTDERQAQVDRRT